jgi:hypothetical protein
MTRPVSGDRTYQRAVALSRPAVGACATTRGHTWPGLAARSRRPVNRLRDGLIPRKQRERAHATGHLSRLIQDFSGLAAVRLRYRTFDDLRKAELKGSRSNKSRVNGWEPASCE